LGNSVLGIREYVVQSGYSERQLPSIANSYSGKLIICGDAFGVYNDLELFGCRDDSGQGKVSKPGWDFMTVNKMVEVLPAHIEHCYSNSASCLNRFCSARRDEYALEFGGPKHRHSMQGPCENIWPLGGHGTSSLGAALVAVGLGYSRIVLCGVPLDDGPHNGEPYWRKTAFASSEAAGAVGSDRNSHWEMAKKVAFDGKVRSMSGRTRTWLGDAMEWK